MINYEMLKKYDFHDSLLENILYDEEKRKVILEIDFCNWRQEWYEEKEKETEMIELIFEEVSKMELDKFNLDSDGIIEFNWLKDKDIINGVEIIIYNDMDNNIHFVKFRANKVIFRKI